MIDLLLHTTSPSIYLGNTCIVSPKRNSRNAEPAQK
nr:MAG TPA: hypothetical protein [Siphoviridae sp. ctMq01]